MRLKAGDAVRWMSPLDYDYLYGRIVSISGCYATVKGGGLYRHITETVHLRYIEKVTGGINCGGDKRNH